jgi:hypothetical protein
MSDSCINLVLTKILFHSLETWVTIMTRITIRIIIEIIVQSVISVSIYCNQLEAEKFFY